MGSQGLRTEMAWEEEGAQRKMEELQQTSQGLKTEMAWEEEGAQRKMEGGDDEDNEDFAEELLLLRQNETEAKASSETLQDEKTLFRNPGLKRACQHRNPWIERACLQRLKAHQEREKAKEYAAERHIRRREAMKKARR